jgi:hypothetical protein
MVNPDTDARRMLVRERHAELTRDALRADTAGPVVDKTLTWRRRYRLRLRRTTLQPRPLDDRS